MLFNNVTLSAHTYSSSLFRCSSETFCFHLCRSMATCRHLHPGAFQRCSSRRSCPSHLRQAQLCSISFYSTVHSMSAQLGSNSFKSTCDFLWGEHLSGVSIITVNPVVSQRMWALWILRWGFCNTVLVSALGDWRAGGDLRWDAISLDDQNASPLLTCDPSLHNVFNWTVLFHSYNLYFSESCRSISFVLDHRQ